MTVSTCFITLVHRLERNVKFVRNLAPSHAQKDVFMIAVYHVTEVTKNCKLFKS